MPERMSDPPELVELDRRVELLRTGEARHTAHWAGSVELELLYWIPFLRRLGIRPDRLTATTASGEASWYASLATGTGSGEPLEPELLDVLVEPYRSDSGPLAPMLARLSFEPLGQASGADTVLVTAGRSGAFSGAAGERLLDAISRSAEREAELVWVDPQPIEAGLEQPLVGLSGSELALRQTNLVQRCRSVVGGFGAATLLGLFFRVPTLVTLVPGERGEPDVETAYRAARRLDAPLSLVDRELVPTVALLAG